MKLKICGLREKENVAAIAALKPGWMGFIFYPESPRYFLNAGERADISGLPAEIKRVGVFVNEDAEEIQRLTNLYGFDFIQLHGDESPEFCADLKNRGFKIIKAFRIYQGFDFSIIESFNTFAEFFLFDAPGKNFGGNGTAFDWNLLQGKRFSRPFLLGGGIGPEEAAHLHSFHHPDMTAVDVNSRFENSPGLKDIAALQKFQIEIEQL